MEARNTNTPSTKSPARSKMTTILLKIFIPDHLYVFHHHGYLLARPVGRDFHEAPGRQRVNPVCGEGRLGGGPRQLQVVGQKSPVYLSARYRLPDPLLLLGLLLLLELTSALLLLLLALLLREEHVVDSDVHLRDVEAHEVLHAVDDVL